MFLARLLPVAALACSIASCGQSRLAESEFQGFNGPSIKMVFDGIPVCVPRRFFNPSDAKQFSELRNPDGSVRATTPPRMALTMFVPNFDGYTDELYLEYTKNQSDRRKSPPTWVRVDLLNSEVTKFRREVGEAELLDFQADSYVDAWGFKSRKRKAECVGKKVGAGATIAIEIGPECVLEELKSAHAEASDVRLLCAPSPGPNRCYTRTVLSAAGVQFVYDFHMSQLPRWPAIHRGVYARVQQWAENHACVGSVGGY